MFYRWGFPLIDGVSDHRSLVLQCWLFFIGEWCYVVGLFDMGGYLPICLAIHVMCLACMFLMFVGVVPDCSHIRF